MEMFNLIDFHTHILPEMDDGASSVEEAVDMINELQSQGVSTIVSTSHYYMQDESVDSFVKRRGIAYNKLVTYANQNNIKLPNIILGAEVLFSPILCDIDCKPLCIGNTPYILLEMPYTKFSSSHFKALENFLNVSGLQCILAHVERYYHFNDDKAVEKLVSHDVLCQINAGSVIDKKLRKKTLKLIKNDCAHILGSDTHNMSSRKPNISDAMKILDKKKLGTELMCNAAELLNL